MLRVDLSTALGAFRIIVGLLFLAQGASKVFGFPDGPAAPTGSFPGWRTGILEVVLGAPAGSQFSDDRGQTAVRATAAERIVSA